MYSETVNQIASHQRDTAAATAFDYSSEVFAGVEKLVELNVQTVKTSLSEQQALADAALSAQSLSEIIDLQSQQLPAAVTKTFAYWRHVEDIAAHTREGLFTAWQQQFDRSLRTFADRVGVASEVVEDEVQQLGETSVLVTEQAVAASAGPVAIVDSLGQVVSSEDARRDLH
ncbi:phasin family protein [Paraburkholderia xenovorans]|uniref:phasin family protein n=1 Tax=Paraburkholderia xenovorans TaxID=36873 RepID=UPI0038BAE905